MKGIPVININQSNNGDHSPFSEFIKRQLGNNLCLGFSSLSSFLITPVQRLPRYLLFLRELRRYTPADHPDYSHLNNSFLLLSEFVFIFILFLFYLYFLFNCFIFYFFILLFEFNLFLFYFIYYFNFFFS